ncbi:hypothetical protein [Streptomyces sp. NPDC006645]|uniref:hypothetical protein n=1 Tax=unclassified Streptomyces TaxID=2593676 RepID=UPI0033B10AC8
MSGAAWAIVVALVVASGVPLGLWACRRDPGPLARPRMARRQGWRYLAHRGGLLVSPSLLYGGIPYGTARQRRRRADRALARLARGEGRACPRGCTTCREITNRAQENHR